MIPFFLSLIALIFGSFVFQFFLPPVLLLKGAAILFVPAIYFYGCVSLPFPLMLALTFVTGFLNDLLLVPQAKDHVDYTAGVSDTGLFGTGIDNAWIETFVSKAPLGTPLAARRNRGGLNPISFVGAIRYLEH